MAVNRTPARPDVTLLPCGRDPAKVWDRAVAGRQGTHDSDCPHCQAVAQDQRLLATAITALAGESLEPPPSLVERVMAGVLAELRPAEYLPLPTRHGQARIDRIAAAGMLRHAVDQMAALRVRSCRIHLREPSGTENPSGVGALPPTARVSISVTAQFGVDLFSAMARVRQMILAAADDLLGLPVSVVDIDVVDVFEDPPRTSPSWAQDS